MSDIDAPLAWRMQQDGYLMQINQLREENAKLRELVSDLYYETKSPSNHATKVEIRMSELGIEVDV